MRSKIIASVKFLTVFAAICLILVTHVSCKGVESDLFAYSKESFSAKVEGSVDGIAIEAIVHFEAAGEGEQSRIMTVSYLAPESLKGLTVSIYSDGTARSRLGNTEIDGGIFHGFAEPFSAIRPSGDYSSVNLDSEENATVEFINDKESVKYYFKKGTRLPVKIEGRVSGRQISVRLNEN